MEKQGEKGTRKEAHRDTPIARALDRELFAKLRLQRRLVQPPRLNLADSAAAP